MPKVVASLYHDISDTEPPLWALSGRNWITLFMIVLVPLAFLRHLDSLRHTSYIALFSVGGLYLFMRGIAAYTPRSLPRGHRHHCILQAA